MTGIITPWIVTLAHLPGRRAREEGELEFCGVWPFSGYCGVWPFSWYGADHTGSARSEEQHEELKLTRRSMKKLYDNEQEGSEPGYYGGGSAVQLVFSGSYGLGPIRGRT